MALGRKTGGRAKGTPNKTTAEKAARIAALAPGVKPGHRLPLDIMLEAIEQVYRGKDGKERNAVLAFPLAKDCAPYLHPRLTSVDAKVSGDLRIEVVKFADGRKAA